MRNQVNDSESQSALLDRNSNNKGLKQATKVFLILLTQMCYFTAFNSWSIFTESGKQFWESKVLTISILIICFIIIVGLIIIKAAYPTKVSISPNYWYALIAATITITYICVYYTRESPLEMLEKTMWMTLALVIAVTLISLIPSEKVQTGISIACFVIVQIGCLFDFLGLGVIDDDTWFHRLMWGLEMGIVTGTLLYQMHLYQHDKEFSTNGEFIGQSLSLFTFISILYYVILAILTGKVFDVDW